MTSAKISPSKVRSRVPARGAKAANKLAVRDPDATRRRILTAAIREFAGAGYSGARIAAICKRARSNPRMVYHYFGDKDGLYLSALDCVLVELRSAELAQLEIDHGNALEGILKLFDFMHGHFGRHPELISLLVGENLQRARFLRRSVKTPLVASPLIQLIRQLIERGVKTRVFRSGIDALQLYVTMAGLSYFPRSNAHTLSAIFRTDLLDPTWQAEQKRHATQLLTRFLTRSQ